MTNDIVLDSVLRAGTRYAARRPRAEPTAEAIRGLAILTCLDTRIDPVKALGLYPGDAEFLRNAGAMVTDEVLGDLVQAVELSGVTHVLVMPHTRCEFEPVASSDDLRATLDRDVRRIRDHPSLVTSLRVAGAIYDTDTGALTLSEGSHG